MTAVFDRDAVLAAVPPADAIVHTREAFARHAAGEWRMPPKVYVDSPPHGDFRAMPAVGDGLAILKWVTSFPHNPARGLPVVAGALLVSDAGSGELRAICDCAAVTSLRTGAAAAVSALELARPGATRAAVIGCGDNGGWAGRCLVAAGYADGVCCDLDAARAAVLAEELGWETGGREEALACDVVVLVTPGDEPVVAAGDLSAGTHVVAMGADSAAKAELTIEAVAACEIYCDEWEQASRGGELSAAVSAGTVGRDDVTELGAVIAGSAPGRSSPEAVTLFDSTGLAIQDLAIARAVLAAHADGRVEAASARL